ncbi:MAG: NusG domain II-containing protein [Hominenteromicrobium sp.]
MEKRKFTAREALLLLILLLLAAALYLWNLMQPAGSTAIIEQNGTELCRVTLSGLSEPERVEANGTVIELSREGARFVSSPCPDQVCVEAGLLTRAGESAVCLPQRVSIRITGGTGADSVTG